jgi:hypothetical protein
MLEEIGVIACGKHRSPLVVSDDQGMHDDGEISTRYERPYLGSSVSTTVIYSST